LSCAATSEHDSATDGDQRPGERDVAADAEGRDRADVLRRGGGAKGDADQGRGQHHLHQEGLSVRIALTGQDRPQVLDVAEFQLQKVVGPWIERNPGVVVGGVRAVSLSASFILVRAPQQGTVKEM
jgi:hypothetical protein